MSKFNGLKVGDAVICNGHPGRVIRLCEWSDSLIEVRLERGDVCVDAMAVRALKGAAH